MADLNQLTDPVFVVSPASTIDNTMISNWNAAFGWGNHATAGYVVGSTGTFTLTTSSSPEWSVVALDSDCRYSRVGNLITIACTISVIRGSGAPGPNTLTLGSLFMPVDHRMVSKSFGRWDELSGAFGIGDFGIDDAANPGQPSLSLHSTDSVWISGNTADVRVVNITATYMIEEIP